MSRQLKRIPIPEPKRRRPPPKDPSVKRETSSTPAPATSDAPQGAYVDYKLTSSRHSDKKWDVFKLQSHIDTPLDLNTWPQPVKLNRKDFKSRNEVEETAGPLTPMLGPDGKPVIGPDGKLVMLNADGTRVKKEDDPKGKKKAKEDPNAKKKAFMKKTRQVHMIPEDVRAFRKEHRKDWLLEDNGGGLAANQSWSGKYSDANDKHIYAFFAPVPGNDKEFRFIPVHRFYNFTKNNNVSSERVESQHARMQAAKNNARTKPKKEEEDEKPVRGVRKLKVVNTGSERYADEDHKPHLGGEGDYDEMEYEDEVQDDEEVPADMPQDEEEKEAVERQKREYLRGKVSERVEPESDEDDEDAKNYTEDGRQLKKLMKKMLAEGESDDDKNPYADTDDEEDEEENKPEQPPAIGVMPSTPSQSGTSTPRPTQGSQQSQLTTQPQKPSQNATAPNNAALRNASPSMGGSALLAQRATSPHPMRKSPSTGTSGSANRATTPMSSTPVPTPGSGGKKRKERPSERGGTPTPPQKRATPTPQSPAPSTPNAGPAGQKKKKSKHDLVAPNGDPLPEVITEEHTIEYLRKMGGAVQTSECITYFKRALKHDPENQKRLTDALKKVSTQAQKGYIKLNSPWADA